VSSPRPLSVITPNLSNPQRLRDSSPSVIASNSGNEMNGPSGSGVKSDKLISLKLCKTTPGINHRSGGQSAASTPVSAVKAGSPRNISSSLLKSSGGGGSVNSSSNSKNSTPATAATAKASSINTDSATSRGGGSAGGISRKRGGARVRGRGGGSSRGGSSGAGSTKMTGFHDMANVETWVCNTA
jgi:hypothetical protein